jgi:hypothetical protein
LRRELALPALAARDPLVGQHPARERGGGVERVQRLVVVADLRVFLGEQQGELVRLVAVGGGARSGGGGAVAERFGAEGDRACRAAYVTRTPTYFN